MVAKMEFVLPRITVPATEAGKDLAVKLELVRTAMRPSRPTEKKEKKNFTNTTSYNSTRHYAISLYSMLYAINIALLIHRQMREHDSML